MPIRDLTIVAVVIVALPFCLARPWIGVLTWSWLAYMNPHRLAWGFSTALPLSQAVAIATLVGFVFCRDRRRSLMSAETILLVALWGWVTVTSVFALYPDDAWEKWMEFSKVLLMALLTIPLFQDRRRLRILVLVIAGSIAFFGFKGGIFALLTGGESMILGPFGSFIGANTEIALALNMTLPLLALLAREERRRRVRIALHVVFVLTIIAVPFTYSRGGVLGLIAVLTLLFVNARRRLLLVPVLAVGLIAFSHFAPQQWDDRMETIRTYETEGSAQLRMMSWRVAYQVATDYPLTGGGFRVLHHREIYDRYLPEYPRAFGHDAHSIYFNFLCDHGWIGFLLFGALIGCTLSSLWKLGRASRKTPETAWISDYASMIQVSLIAWLLNGAFLSVAYFDLAYHLIIITVVLKAMAAAAPAAVTAAAATPPRPVLWPGAMPRARRV